MTDDVDVLDSVLEKESGGKDYVIETTEGEITYTMHRVKRTRRHEFIESLPDEVVEEFQEQANEARDGRDGTVDLDDVEGLDDIPEQEPDAEEVNGTALTKDAVQEMEDLIVESFSHPKISDRETRDLLELWPDKQFFVTSFLILGYSNQTEAVKDFRTE